MPNNQLDHFKTGDYKPDKTVDIVMGELWGQACGLCGEDAWDCNVGMCNL